MRACSKRELCGFDLCIPCRAKKGDTPAALDISSIEFWVQDCVESLAGPRETAQGSHTNDQAADTKNKLGWESRKARWRDFLNRADVHFHENLVGMMVLRKEFSTSWAKRWRGDGNNIGLNLFVVVEALQRRVVGIKRSPGRDKGMF